MTVIAEGPDRELVVPHRRRVGRTSGCEVGGWTQDAFLYVGREVDAAAALRSRQAAPGRDTGRRRLARYEGLVAQVSVAIAQVEILSVGNALDSSGVPARRMHNFDDYIIGQLHVSFG